MLLPRDAFGRTAKAPLVTRNIIWPGNECCSSAENRLNQNNHVYTSYVSIVAHCTSTLCYARIRMAATQNIQTHEADHRLHL